MKADADQRLLAQIEYLRSDERLRERAAAAMEVGPEVRLEEARQLGIDAMRWLDQLPADVRARVDGWTDALGPGAEDVLPRLARLSAPR